MRLALTDGCRWKRTANSSRRRRHRRRPWRREHVLAVERVAVGRQHQRALVDHVEVVGIAVMRRAQRDGAALLLALDRDVVRAADDRRAGEQAPDAADSRKRHDDVSLKVTVECAAVARATCRQFSRLVAGRPQLTTRRCCLPDSSNDRQPACASWLAGSGGGAAGVHQQHGRRRLDALVAGMRRVRQRRAARVVIGEHGGEQIGRRRAHAVEQREVAVAVAEEAQHRHHAVDGVESAGGGAMLRARERLRAAAAGRSGARSARRDCG